MACRPPAAQSLLCAALVLALFAGVLSTAASGQQPPPDDDCTQDLGALGASAPLLSGSGIVARDADCTSSLRDPQSSATFYARRHTFSLDAPATVSVSADDAPPGSLRTYLVVADASGTVVGRDAGDSRYKSSSVDRVLLGAGTYTAEVTTYTAGGTGGYTVRVSWAEATACTQDLGALGASAPLLSGSGIVARDADCTSSLRDPQSSATFYARRHTFSLDAPATVSVSADDAPPGSLRTYLVVADASGTVVGRDAGDSRYKSSSVDRVLLGAGTYTAEVTTYTAGGTGGYTVRVSWAEATACTQDLGALGASAPLLSGSGIVARDADCTSSLRDPQSSATFYARRHTFSLDAPATVSVSADDAPPGSLRTYLVVADASGTVVGRDAGDSRYKSSSVDRVLLGAGTYTAEVTTYTAGGTGGYTVRVSWAEATACTQDLGALGASAPLLSGSGIVARDADCTSSLRDPQSSATFYARRHTFSLDAPATVSVSADDAPPGSLRTYLVVADASGTVVGRDAGDSRYKSSSVDRVLLGAGTYTAEVTTYTAGGTGGYTVRVSWAEATACTQDLGALGASAPLLSGSGIVARDADCTSSLRDPQSSATFYARRHTFSLDAPATVSVSADDAPPGSLRTYLVVADASGTVVGRDAGDSRYKSSSVDRVLLGAGTYTAEVTTYTAGGTGGYTVRVSWAEATACTQDLGALGASAPLLSGSGIVARDADCTSSLRDPQSSATFYARRHTFSLDAPATVSVSADDAPPGSLRTYLVVADASGTVVGRDAGDSRYKSSSVDRVLLGAGTYTAEVTTYTAGGTGGYTVRVSWAEATACTQDLGALGASAPLLSGSGIVARDADCTSSLRDPQSSATFYARRHTFSLDAPATVSVSADDAPPGSLRTYLVVADASGTVVGRDAGDSRYKSSSVDRVLLGAGTYTAEVTTYTAGGTGGYTVRVSWAEALEPLAVVLVNSSTVELVYDAVLDEGSVPPAGAFGVVVGGSGRDVGSVAVEGQVVRVGLASPVLSGQVVVVSYAVPAGPGEDRVEAANGPVAAGFSGRAAVVPQDPPTITSVTSSGDGSRAGLLVGWTQVGESSGYELRWRRPGEQTWQQSDAGAGLEFTVYGLVRGAIYEVQSRAVTAGGRSGHVLYATAWSGSAEGIAGGWTPANVAVAPTDGGLVVSWDDVPAATSYEVQWWAADSASERAEAAAEREGGRWRAEVSGLANGESYVVAVRSVRIVVPGPVPLPIPAVRTASDWVESFAVPGSYLGARMSTFQYLGVLYDRRRVIAYDVWWDGACGGDYMLWDRWADEQVWSRVHGFAYSDNGAGRFWLTAPDLGLDTGSFLDYRAVLNASEGRRLQLRCSPAEAEPSAEAEEPPGVLVGEVVFHRGSDNPPPPPPNIQTAAGPGGSLVVFWDGFSDSELARVRSSVVGYEVQWRWFDGGAGHTAGNGARLSPLQRSHTIQDLVPGRAYGARVRARSSTGDGAWSPYTGTPVVIVPDPPKITGLAPGRQSVAVSWELVDSANGYDVQWRPDGETAWQSAPRTGNVDRYLIGGLADATLYWVRVRAAHTEPAPSGATVYTTGWSQQHPAVAGDWAPTNLQAAPGYRSLTLTWDEAADADGYEIEYRAAPDGAWARYRRSRFATGPVDGPPVTLWGLADGAPHHVRIRSVRQVASVSGGQTTVRSAWADTAGVPGELRVAQDQSPLLVRGGEHVVRAVRLEYGGPGRAPFAYRRIFPVVVSGPSAGTAVKCMLFATPALTGLADPYVPCITNDEGKLLLAYTANSAAHKGHHDIIRLFADTNNDRTRQNNEPHTDLHPIPVASRPPNLVALGDSYSAGENGTQHDPAGFPEEFGGGEYLDDHPAALDCRRWDKAYARLLPSLQRTAFQDVDTYACTGSITLNIFDPDDTDNDGLPDGVDVSQSVLDIYPHRIPTTFTNRPSWQAHDFDPAPGADQHSDWEPRQAVSLRQANAQRTVDMVTLTIGGNDAGFGNVLNDCYLGGCASYLESPERAENLEELGSILTSVFTELRSAAPDAAIFMLGYPYLVPYNDIDYYDYLLGGQSYLFAEVDDCVALSAYPLLEAARLGFIEGDAVIDMINSFEDMPNLWERVTNLFGPGLFGGSSPPNTVANTANRLLKIDTNEKVLLMGAVEAMNRLIESSAEAAGVHFVAVKEEFFGHDPCGPDPWLNGVVVDERLDDQVKLSGRSFHPNRSGHEQFARILLDHIEAAIERGDRLNAGGLPVNPPPVPPSTSQRTRSSHAASSSSGDLRSDAGEVTRGSQPVPGSSGVPKLALAEGSDAGERSDSSGESEEPDGSGGDRAVGSVLLWGRRVSPSGSRCSSYLAPGDRVALLAESFEPDTSVAFEAVAVTVTGVLLPEVLIPADTADTDGRIEVEWSVPAALAGEDTASPRAYFVKASGTRPDGTALAALTPGPMVAYPQAAPCASDDAATTTVGVAVRVAVLGNDTAPSQGSLDPASVTVATVHGGKFAVDSTDGSLTFTPDPGFVGTAAARYRVADNWGLRVSAEVVVTVEAGCTITGVPGVERIVGTAGDDVICVPNPLDRSAFHIIDAKAGNDIILGSDGAEIIVGGPGDDTVYARGGGDRIAGGPGADKIYSGPGADIVYSDDLADAEADTVVDGDGYELLLVPPAQENAAPVAGDDALSVSPGETVEIPVLDNDYDPDGNLVAGSLSIVRQPASGAAGPGWSEGGRAAIAYTAASTDGVDSFAYQVCDTLGACATAEVAVAIGTPECTITGTEASETIWGTYGDDVICAGGGNDTIHGLEGNDIIYGGAGNDTIFGQSGRDIIYGGAGSDTVFGQSGRDIIYGGAGDDDINAGAGNDTVFGQHGKDRINGLDGNDIIYGGAGNDTLWGTTGDDAIYGGAGDDILWGGTGDDAIYGNGGRDTAHGGVGDDTIFGGAGDDTLRGREGNDTIYGGPGNDHLEGNDHNDTLRGGAGNDLLSGGNHQDIVLGEAGNDTLFGSAGNDTTYGGPGNDHVFDGPGSDYADGGEGDDACTETETTARCET